MINISILNSIVSALYSYLYLLLLQGEMTHTSQLYSEVVLLCWYVLTHHLT